jgi:hypothetical protein
VYFVAKDGSDANPGSEAEPWLTIQHAAQVLSPGDTAYIKAGVYRERVSPQSSGTADRYIHFTAYPGQEGQVILDGAGISFSGAGLFSILNKAYLKITNLQVVNSDDAAIYVRGSHHIILAGNRTMDSHSSGIGVWVSSYVLIEGNTIVNARNVPMDQGGHEECLTVSDTSTFQVRNNEVYYADESKSYLGGAGIDVKEGSQDGQIYGNYLHNIPRDAGIYIDAWDSYNHDHLVFRNLIRDAGGIAVGSESGGTAENITVHDNVVVRSGWTGIIISQTGEGRGGDGPRRNIRIFNNTVYEARGHGGAGIYVVSENVENIIIKNNVVSFGWGSYGPNGWESGWVGQITAATPTILTHVTAERNLTFGPEKCSEDFPDCRQIPGSLKVDPVFLDRLNEDLRLQATSPAVDAGSDLRAEGVTSDFDGIRRPQGPGFDLGAFEYAEPDSVFVDVPPTRLYHDEIESLYRNGYTAGCNTDPLMYCPDATMNRAESAVFVERGIHSATYDPPVPATQVFADLALDSWASKWVNGLWEDEFTAGCGTNPLVYCPWQGHSRAEGCVFYLRMMRGAGYEPPQSGAQVFSDVPLDAWYAKWAQAAYDAELIDPCETVPELRFCPEEPLSRALAAHMMVQAKGLALP